MQSRYIEKRTQKISGKNQHPILISLSFASSTYSYTRSITIMISALLLQQNRATCYACRHAPNVCLLGKRPCTQQIARRYISATKIKWWRKKRKQQTHIEPSSHSLFCICDMRSLAGRPSKTLSQAAEETDLHRPQHQAILLFNMSVISWLTYLPCSIYLFLPIPHAIQLIWCCSRESRSIEKYVQKRYET